MNQPGTAQPPSSVDASWIRETHARYAGPLYRYALRLTNDGDLAQEIVQDAFLKLCREPPVGRDGQVGEWLYTVCRHRAIDISRKANRMTAATVDVLDGIASPHPLPTEVAEQRETGLRLLDLVDGLPAQQQEIVRLKFQGGLAYREIGEVLGLSESHVGVLLHQALATLRRRLKPAM